MEKIAILDFGSQFTQLVARRVRELQVYCEIFPPTTSDAALKDFAAAGYILSGGPQSVLDHDAPSINPGVIASEKPILGICYGMQAMMKHFGGGLERDGRREYGAAKIRLQKDCPLWRGIDKKSLQVWMSHGDHVNALAPGFHAVAQTESEVIAAVAHAEKPWYGLQFHPEVSHTECGGALLQNFLRQICRLHGEWTIPSVIEQHLARIRQQVGQDRVLLALSGGVDSAVLAALLHRAIGDQLHCVLVDNGLLRENEAANIRRLFDSQFGLNLEIIDAGHRFFSALRGVIDPEEKRRRIGHLFIEIFEEVAKRHTADWLAQGTIYPDVVESAKGGSGKATIKTHHNVGGLPERLALRLLEPLRDLFKDEVRAIGRELGLGDSFIRRHPFPGPGLAVRVLGEVTPERIATVRQADALFLEDLEAAGAEVAQAFAVLLPVHSVGVMGDDRTYENVIALRAVITDDFMTADWARLPEHLLARTANRIINQVRGVNRVVYDISSKPPATVEWE